MSRGINKVILVGTAGKDPETRYMPSGGAVTNISIATNESWKDKTTGETKEKCEWHNLVFFGKLAEIVGQYVTKGSQIYVEGKLQTRKWQDKEGVDRYSTDINCHEMQMLGGKPSSNNPNQASQNTPAPDKPDNSQYPPQVEEGFDDDIPF